MKAFYAKPLLAALGLAGIVSRADAMMLDLTPKSLPSSDPAVPPVKVTEVKTTEQVMKECNDLIVINENGSVSWGCFVAGTLVHTDKGLMPIESIRVGTRVLSQPERSGGLDYRPVLSTVAHLDQQVYAVQIQVDGSDTLTTLFATGNHPFWVEGVQVQLKDPSIGGENWLAAECLQPGHTLQLSGGGKAQVHAAGLVRRTQHAHLGLASDDRAGIDIVLDLSDKQIKLADAVMTRDLPKLEPGEPWLMPVYNFEVEEFHTYYVGEAGIWVHNTTCSTAAQKTIASTATEFAQRADQLKAMCFGSDTLVHQGDGACVEIEHLRVGSFVLSRNELTGEMALKRITKIYERSAHKYGIMYNAGPEHVKKYGGSPRVPTYVTGEHPFWVQGKGWVAVRDLQPGDALLTYNGDDPTSIKAVYTPEELKPHYYTVPPVVTVYNLEVEDFNTYFVDLPGVWVHNCNNTPLSDIARLPADIQANGNVFGVRSSIIACTPPSNSAQTTCLP